MSLKALAFLTGLVPFLAFGQQPPVVSAEAAPTYQISIELLDEEPVVYGDAVSLAIGITSSSGMDVESLEVVPIGRLGRLYDRVAQDEQGKWNCLAGVAHLIPGRPQVLTCDVVSTHTLREQIRPSWLLQPSKRHKFLVIITAREGEESTRFFEQTHVSFVSSKLTILFGGLFGAILLALFTGLKSTPLLAPPRNFSDAKLLFYEFLPSTPWRLWAFARSSILGGICALILILVAQVTEGSQTPLSVQINDFWGGVVVGLFSVPLSRWIATRLASIGGAVDGDAAPRQDSQREAEETDAKPRAQEEEDVETASGAGVDRGIPVEHAVEQRDSPDTMRLHVG